MTTDNEAVLTSAALRERRETIVAAMSRYIARPDRATPTPEHEAAAGALVDATLASFSGDEPLAPVWPANVDRQVIIRFGDGLLPILKDIVGPDVSPTALARLSDAYWRTVDRAGVPANQFPADTNFG